MQEFSKKGLAFVLYSQELPYFYLLKFVVLRAR